MVYVVPGNLNCGIMYIPQFVQVTIALTSLIHKIMIYPKKCCTYINVTTILWSFVGVTLLVFLAGGFAKVKLAYHVLTGDKVAIKIMDKHTLGVRFNFMK